METERFSPIAVGTRLLALFSLRGVLITIVVTLAALGILTAAAFAQAPEANVPLLHGQNIRQLPVRPQVPLADAQTSEASADNSSAIVPGPAGAHLTYYGGPVVSNVEIIMVEWGSGSYLSNIDTLLPAYYTALVNGSYMDLLSEYSTNGLPSGNQFIQHGTYFGVRTITPSVSSATVTDAQVQSELAKQITAGHLPGPSTDAGGHANTIYMVYFPHGKTITQGGSNSCQAGGFCAYHGTASIGSSPAKDILYGVLPDMQAGSGCDTGCGTGTTLQNYTSVASHEFAETITDAEVGFAITNAPPLAWYDNTNGEVGDICNAVQGTADGYTVQAEWSNLQNGCVVGPAAFQVSAPANANTGTPFNVTVTAKKSDATNLGSAYKGTLHFGSSDSGATLPADYTFVAGDNGAHTFSVTLANAGSQTINVNDARSTGFTGSASVNASAVTPATVTAFRVLFGSQSLNLMGSSRNRLPWQIAGIQVTFSKPITTGDVNSLTGVIPTGFSGLGTNTLTWTISPLSLGDFTASLVTSGADALKDSTGTAVAAASQGFRVLNGDFNDDGAVNSSDMVLVNNARVQPYNIFADINGDGVVDINDVQIVRAKVGSKLP